MCNVGTARDQSDDSVASAALAYAVQARRWSPHVPIFQVARPVYERRHTLGEQEEAGLRRRIMQSWWNDNGATGRLPPPPICAMGDKITVKLEAGQSVLLPNPCRLQPVSYTDRSS